jgi:uncharacterized LabA/DUF88 family protein
VGEVVAKKAVFIDGSNLFHACRRRGRWIDYEKFKAFLGGDSADCVVTYYCSRPAKTPPKQLRFLYALQDLGYCLRVTILKPRGRSFVEKGVDAAIVDDLNALLLSKDRVDVVAVASGDMDYYRTLRRLKEMGVKVELVAFEDSISTEQRLLADKFISIDKNLDQFELRKRV